MTTTLTETKTADLESAACRIRVECLKSIYTAGSGHPGGSFSAAEIMAVLYFHQMNIDPARPTWAGRDRFILSKGHVAPVLYTTLALRGYFPVDELKTLRRLDSRLQGHPAFRKTPGVDMTSGSLGQGLSVALGIRLGARMRKQEFKVYVLLGDGEIQEGQVWEAAMASAHFKIDHLVAVLDYNHVQLDGMVESIMNVAPVHDKWRSFGWEVLDADGHCVADLAAKLEQAAEISRDKPVIVIAKTVKGKGVSFMEGQAAWHGSSPDCEQFNQALNELAGKRSGKAGG